MHESIQRLGECDAQDFQLPDRAAFGLGDGRVFHHAVGI
jgi:hypothetical protein